jgi:hypothetical protein
LRFDSLEIICPNVGAIYNIVSSLSSRIETKELFTVAWFLLDLTERVAPGLGLQQCFHMMWSTNYQDDGRSDFRKRELVVYRSRLGMISHGKVGLGIVALLAAVTPASAIPVTYYDSFVGTGSLGGQAFTNAAVTLSASLDTANVIARPPPGTPGFRAFSDH